MIFCCSLSDSKFPQVYVTLLSILAVLNNVGVWMLSTRPSNCKSSSLSNNPLTTVPKASITIGIIVTFMFHRFFNSQAMYLLFYSLSFSFFLVILAVISSNCLFVFIRQPINNFKHIVFLKYVQFPDVLRFGEWLSQIKWRILIKWGKNAVLRLSESRLTVKCFERKRLAVTCSAVPAISK